MKSDEVLKEWAINDLAFVFLQRVYSILRKKIGRELSLSEALALMGVLTSYEINLGDGLVMNNDIVLEETVGLREAAAIASLLCSEQQKEPRWFYREFLMMGEADESFRQATRWLTELLQPKQTQ